MKYEITEEQIREAHNAACSELKQKIESWYPECFKPKLEINKWYKAPKYGSAIFYLTQIIGETIKAYGVNFDGLWVNENDWYAFLYEEYEPATDEEVFSMLKKEAEKRGYGLGNFYCLYHNTLSKDDCITQFNPKDNIFWINYGCVFDNGKWATIVEKPKEMTLEEIEKQLGHKIKIVR